MIDDQRGNSEEMIADEWREVPCVRVLMNGRLVCRPARTVATCRSLRRASSVLGTSVETATLLAPILLTDVIHADQLDFFVE